MRSRVVMVALLVGCSHASPGHSEAPASAPAAAAPVANEAPAARAVAPAPAPGAAGTAASRARTVDVTETRFGLTVADPYRWMEGNQNPELDAWLIAEGERTAAYLARLPGRDALRARVLALGNATGTARGAQLVAGKLFYFEIAPGEQLAKVKVREAGKVRTLVDPAAYQTGARHASVDGFAPSPDGKKLTFNVSGGGSELAVIHVLDIATGKELPDRVERVFGQLEVAWLPDSRGFFYTQLAPRAPGVDPVLNSQARLHLLGAPADADVAVLGAGVGTALKVAPNELPIVAVPPGSRWLMVAITGARIESRYAIAPVAALDSSGAGKTPWRAVAEYTDGVQQAAVHGDRVFLLSYKDASNLRVVSVPVDRPDVAAARVDIAEDPSAALVSFADARDALYVVKRVEGRARLLRWPWRGEAAAIALPFDGWINELATDPARDGVLFNEQGWTHPLAFFAYDPGRKAVVPDALVMQTNADFTGIVADEVEAVSADGTRVPVSIVRRTDTARDAARPAILSGYAGYGVSETPFFSPTRLAWLERGGVYAVCHGRGGGEKGHAWHVDGARERKMNGIHDFEACAQALIDARLTSPAHLFAQGGSMGGILIGRAVTDRPALFAAANIQVGVVNPLRMLAAQNGATQIAELGDPETEAGYRSMYEMDPYHHVAAAAYPAMLFSIGLNDPRVSPWMTGKMAARMQALSTSGKPVLIRVDRDAGHGIGSTRDQAFAARADEWSFFLAASGDPAFQPR